MHFSASQKNRLRSYAREEILKYIIESPQNDELVEETTDCLIRLLHAACANNADEAVAEENSRLTQEFQMLQSLGSVYTFEERNRISQQAATKRVFEVVHEMYNKKHESNRK